MVGACCDGAHKGGEVSMAADTRPTKKQRELLVFIDGFIKGNGYGPSYREIMRALDYRSVSTVATHIDGLIARGYLRKIDHSARTLEVVSTDIPESPVVQRDTIHVAWLRRQIEERRARKTEQADTEADILQSALEILDPKGEEKV